MLEEFDKLNIYANEYDKMTEDEIQERIKKRDELIKKMTDEEIEELLSRNILGQYKAKIKRLREEK